MSDKLAREINKKIGKNVISRGNEILDILRIPTGSLSLDVETGGGIPVGRITSIVGEWSAAKTSATLKIGAEFQKLWPKKEIVWIDAEGVFDHKWARALGLNPDEVAVVRPEYGEQAYNIALAYIDDGAGLVVIDSLAALSSKKEMESDMDEVTVAAMARVNSKFLRKMNKGFSNDPEDVPPTLIYLNQYRQNVGGYGGGFVEPGGEALTYYPSLKIVLKKGDLFDGKKTYKYIGVNDEGVEVKAQQIKFYTEKNKTAPFKRRGHVWFYFDGLDKYRTKGSYDRLEEAIRLARKYNIVIQRGSAFDLPDPRTGEVTTFRGSGALAEHIRSDDAAREFIESQVLKRVVEDMTDVYPQEEEASSDVSSKPVVRNPVDEYDEEGEGSGEDIQRAATAGIG